MESNPTQIFTRGVQLLRSNRIPEASNAFRRVFKLDPDNPRYLSYYGLILALADDNFQDAVNFCRAAILRAAYEPEFYLNLSKVYARAGQRKKALETLLEGLSFNKNNVSLKMEMKRMGMRRKPILPFLSRNHILNKSLGELTYQLRRGRSRKNH